MDWIRAASTSADKADAVFLAVTALAVLALVSVTGLMIYFLFRYNHRRHPRAEQIEGHALLEVVWTLVPLVIFVVIFYYGWTTFEYSRNPPRDAMAVRVTGRQWRWGFTYPNGKQTATLHAPVNRPMKLEVVSDDVIHSCFIPAFRLKVDAVPGLTNHTWFQATRPGAYDLMCTVICGVDHSAMITKVNVVTEKEFRAWYFACEDAPEPHLPGSIPEPMPAAGEHAGLAVMRAKGCLECHSVDGTPMVGPTLQGLFGRREKVLVGGQPTPVTVDEARLRKAIAQPGEESVVGYPLGVMPKVPLEEGEMAQVVDCIKSLSK
jgi:cytochrome c oxidase subunit II